ncbi:MAG: PPOX class F420-dependent oxidoreductase [Actinomycetes bacterium]
MTATTTAGAESIQTIPASHLDLLVRPVSAVLSTIGSDGSPQSSIVWVDYDSACVRVNTTTERQKARNILENPKVSVLIVDPENNARYLQIRGDAEVVTRDAVEHLDTLTRKYTRHPRYYGFVYPVEQQARETRIVCRIHPKRVTIDAIHA